MGSVSFRLIATVWRARAEIATAEIEHLAVELSDEIAHATCDDVMPLYAQLRAVLEAGDTAANRQRFDELLERLRRAQATEADVMGRYFELHRPLQKGSGTSAIGRAEQLVQQHESAATENVAIPRPNKAGT
jgi:hypothetical protein